MNTITPTSPPEQTDSLSLSDSTWLISDTHFFHANIGQYCSRPAGWQELIVENWNRLIRPGEPVFHLGDLSLGKKEDTEVLVPLLNGRLYLLRGNHDRWSASFYQSLGIILVKSPPYIVEYKPGLKLLFSHHPLVPLPPRCFNLHGHIHNNPAPELGPRHINLSIEVRDYRPWRMGEILAYFQ